MNRDDSVLRYLNGELSPVERQEFEARLTLDKRLRGELSFAKNFGVAARRCLSDESDRRLDPFFVDHLMKTVAGFSARPNRQEEFLDGLVRWFSPVTVVSLAIIAALVFGNIAGTGSRSGSVAESVLGLPAVTIANVYDLEYE